MIFRLHFLLILLTGFVLSCSTGPEFERDNVNDAEATSPNGVFIYPSEMSTRGPIEEKSFTIKVTKGVVEKKLSIILISDVDGEFYNTESTNSIEFDIGSTKLSKGIHKVTLKIDSQIYDDVTVNVNRPNKIKLRNVQWNGEGYEITWSKFNGSNFDRYNVYSRETDGTVELVAEIRSKSDTTFTHFDSPLEKKFEYFVQIYSKDFTLPYISNNFMVISSLPGSDGESFSEFPYLTIFDNDTLLIYKNQENKIKAFNIKNRSFFTLFNGEPIGNLYVNNYSNPAVIIGSSYDYGSPSFFSTVDNLSNSTEINFNQKPGWTDGPPSYVIFEPNLEVYFVSFGYQVYSFNESFNMIQPILDIQDEDAGYLVGFNTKNNSLFGVQGFSPMNLAHFSYDNNARITSSRGAVNRFNTTSTYFKNAVSEVNNRIIVGTPGHIYSADQEMEYFGTLSEGNGYYTAFALDESTQDTIYAASSGKYFYKIFLPQNEIVYQKKIDYIIDRIFFLGNKIYVLQQNNGLYRVKEFH